MGRLHPLLLLGTAVLTSCMPRPEPPPLSPPPIETWLIHQATSHAVAADAPVAVELDVQPEDALAVVFQLDYLEALSSPGMPSVTGRTRLVASVRGDDVLMPLPVIVGDARIGVGQSGREFLERLDAGESGRWTRLVTYRGALPVGVRTSLRGRSEQPISLGSLGQVHRTLAVSLSRDENEIVAAIESLALLPPGSAEEEELFGNEVGPTDGDVEVWREVVVLEDAPVVDGEPLVLVFRSNFPGHEGGRFVLRIGVASPPTDPQGAEQHAAAVRRCLGDVQNIPLGPLRDVRVEGAPRDAVSTLELVPYQRRTGVYLADRAGATLSSDLILAASDEDLIEMGTSLRARLRDAPEPGVEPSWVYDRETLLWVTEVARQRTVPPELEAVLLRHCGEMAHFPALLGDMVTSSPDRVTFDRLLLAEHGFFLEDPSPAARVRAFEWLGARGAAPEGYDPFADRDERRAAVRAWEAAREAAAAGESAP